MNQSINPIDQVLQQVKVAQAMSYEGLTSYPLIRNTLFDKDYLTLDDFQSALNDTTQMHSRITVFDTKLSIMSAEALVYPTVPNFSKIMQF